MFQRGYGSNAAFEFKHALVQSAAHESLLHSKRRALHSQIAKLLEEKHEGSGELRPEILAYHHEEAEEYETAIAWHLRAGEDAQARSTYEEAINHFETAIALVRHLPNAEQRVRRELELLSHLRNALVVAKGYAATEVEKACARSRELCERIADERELFDVLWNLTGFYMVRGDHETTKPINQSLLEIAASTADRELEIMAKDTVAQTEFYLGNFVESRKLFDQAIALYEKQQHRSLCLTYAEEDPLVASLAFISVIDVLTGHLDRGARIAAEATAVAEQLPYEHSQALATSYRARTHTFRRDLKKTRDLSEVMLAFCAEKGIAYYMASAKMTMGWSLVVSEGSQRGHSLILEGIHEAQETGAKVEHSFSATLLAESFLKTGAFEEGLRLLDEDLAQAEQSKENWCTSESLRLKGELLIAIDRRNEEEACALFKKAMAITDEQGARLLQIRNACSLARILHERDHSDEARGLLDPLYRGFSEGFDTFDLLEAKRLLGL